MAELSPADVEAFTDGRLAADDPEVARMLAAALVIARREAGWHVSPVVQGDTCLLDAPRSNILALPTLRVLDLIEVAEDEVALDLKQLRISGGRPPGGRGGAVTLRRKHHYYGCWPAMTIAVTMDHGYTEDEAADWRHAILMMVDAMSTMPVLAGTGRSAADLTSKQVDDVSYSWRASGINEITVAANSVAYSIQALLAAYQIPPVYFS